MLDRISLHRIENLKQMVQQMPYFSPKKKTVWELYLHRNMLTNQGQHSSVFIRRNLMEEGGHVFECYS